MQTHPPTGSQTPPPQPAMIQLLTAAWAAKAVGTVAELGVADRLAGGPVACADLAVALGVNEGALYRLLRAVASVGVFTEVSPRVFALNPMGETLRTGVPGSLRGVARMWNADWHERSWSGMLHSVRTGGIAFDHLFGEPLFDWLGKHREHGEVFNQAMTDFSTLTAQAVLDAYDFSGIGLLTDVGGGHGRLISSILAKHPGLRGQLYDLPEVVAGAGVPKAAGVADRCRIIGGSFFENVPASESFILSVIIHDWDDERASIILRNCRKAISPAGRLLVVDTVIPPGDQPHLGKLLDLEMLLLPGGKERTETEFRELFARCGFALSRVVSTRGPMSVVEGRPV